MRFCAVLRKYPKDVPGGAEYQSYLISRELAKRGHETHYVAYQSDRVETIEDEGITVHRLNATKTQALEALKDIRADIYYFRLALDLPLLWRAKRQLDSTFVYNISRDIQCQPLFSGGLHQPSKGLLQNLVSMGRYAIYRYLLRVPDVIFTQTRQQQALLEENHDLQSTLIGNGHPVPDPDFKKETPPVVLWLSSLKRVKNPETFIRLFEATEDLSCQFWIVGRPVNEEVHEYVQQKADQHEKLEYLGGCGVQESNEYFKKASVYVHTGGSEGFPNTFIQSWLHRTPVVSFSTDPDSAIKNNTIGVRCKSIKEAKETITQMIEDPEYCGQISMNAREYGINNHSIEKITDRIERRLETLIEETHNTETE